MGKFKDFFDKTFAREGIEEEETSSPQEEKNQANPYVRPAESMNKNTLVKNMNKSYGDYAGVNDGANKLTNKKASVIKMTNTTGAKVHTFEPSSLDDASKAIDYLNNGYAVLLNLEKTDKYLSQRIIDVVTGALYLLEGEYSAITDDIYLLAPKGVEISSALDAKNAEETPEQSAAKNAFKFKK